MIQEPKSTQYGGLSKEEWDQLKPWQQFKHLDKIKNPGHYYIKPQLESWWWEEVENVDPKERD
jgi:hypothetical protein